MVSNKRVNKVFLWQFFSHSPLLNVWAVSIIAFTIIRVRLRPFTSTLTKNNSILRILLDTFGLSFGTTSGLRDTRQNERLITVIISSFALISSIYCSGMLIQHRSANINVPSYQTKDDIIRDRIPILYPTIYWNKDVPVEYAFELLPIYCLYILYSFSFFLSYVNEILESMSNMILQQNTSYAYLLPSQTADMLLANPNILEDNRPVFRRIIRAECSISLFVHI